MDRPLGPSWPFLLLALAVLGAGLAAWRPIPTGVAHDDGVYMLVGHALATGEGLRYDGVEGAPPAAKFPPLYSAFLAILWGGLREVGRVTLVATLSNLLLLAAAAAFLARGLHEGAGLPRRVALVGGGLGVLSGEVLRTSSVTLSEPLFLALVGGAFALWSGASEPGSNGSSEEGTNELVRGGSADRARGRARLLLALLLALIVLTRAAGLALVAGFGLAILAGGGLRRGLVPALLVTGPALAAWTVWSAWARARGAEIPSGLRDLLGPYGGWMRAQLFTDPARTLAGLPGHALAIVERVAALALPRLTGLPLWIVFLPLAVVIGYGWARALRRHPPLAWSTGAYALVLLAWPYVDRRLVAPLHVLLCALAVLGGWTLWVESGREGAGGLRVAAVRLARAGAVFTLLWVGGYTVVSASRIAEGWPASAHLIRAGRLAAAVEALERTAPADAVVGAPELWAALHLHGGWTTVPSVLFTPGGSDGDAPIWGSPEQQVALWRETGARYLLLEQGGTLHEGGLDLLERRCPGSVRVVAQLSPQLIVEIDPERSCPRSP